MTETLEATPLRTSRDVAFGRLGSEFDVDPATPEEHARLRAHVRPPLITEALVGTPRFKDLQARAHLEGKTLEAVLLEDAFRADPSAPEEVLKARAKVAKAEAELAEREHKALQARQEAVAHRKRFEDFSSRLTEAEQPAASLKAWIADADAWLPEMIGHRHHDILAVRNAVSLRCTNIETLRAVEAWIESARPQLSELQRIAAEASTQASAD